MAFVLRAVPQLFFVGRKFPESLDRWLQYLSYAFICSIISVTLFVSKGEIESSAALSRAIALALAVIVARATKSAVSGMIAGAIFVFVLSRVFS
jgi:branched-subunit amino acid transport protein